MDESLESLMSCVALCIKCFQVGFSEVSVIGITEIEGNFIGKNLGTSIEKQQLTANGSEQHGHVANSVIVITKLA